MQQQRNLPQNIEAERSVLGCMLISREAAYLANERLNEEDFFLASHKEIYRAMKSVAAQGRPIDLVTLAEELSRTGSLEGVGGAAYLTDLSRFVPTTANIGAYIQIVEERSIQRRLIEACDKITAECLSGQMELSELLNMSEKLIYNISMKQGDDALLHINPSLLATYDTIEQLYINKGSLSGIPTGYEALDTLTTGLHGGEFVLIGGRPSMGKSSLGMNIVEYAAVKRGFKTAVFSLEMPREQLALRLLCSYSLVHMQSVRQGTLTDDDWMKLAEALGPLGQAPIYIDSTSGISVPEVRSRCRRMQLEHGLDLVVIDYLQLMSASGKNESRQNEVSEISRMLKALALELNVPVIALAQLSRTPQGRADHRPVLSDIRDSGAIEQDADVVMFIYRDDYYNKEESAEQNVAEIILAKQRNGPLGTVKLAWLGEYTKFVSLPPGYQGGE